MKKLSLLTLVLLFSSAFMCLGVGKGERITGDKDVAVQTSGSTGFSAGGRSETRGHRSGGLSSRLPYILGIVIIGAGVFLYHRRKQEAKKIGYKGSENDSSSEIPKY